MRLKFINPRSACKRVPFVFWPTFYVDSTNHGLRPTQFPTLSMLFSPKIQRTFTNYSPFCYAIAHIHMCRMIGIVGVTSSKVQQALTAFYPLCEKGRAACGDTSGHGDGWGLSGHSGSRAVFFGRSAGNAAKEKSAFQTAAQRASQSKSPVLISHFRKASAGAAAVGNSHPFHFRDWVFAHNGTVFNAASALALGEAQPQGQTDSERLGLWLMEKMVTAMDPTAVLVESIQQLREKTTYSSLTFLMSNGKSLWAYREFGDKNLEKGESLDDRDGYFSLVWTFVDNTFIVSSEPLPELGHLWKALPNQTLAYFESGMDAPKIQSL